MTFLTMDIVYKSSEFLEDFTICNLHDILAATSGKFVFIINLKTKEIIFEYVVEDMYQEIESLHFDKTGKLIADHRSHITVWDGKNIYTPEFQDDNLPGFCYMDSNSKGEYLFYHPVRNKIYLVTSDLKTCTEISVFRSMLDFTNINAFFLNDAAIVVSSPLQSAHFTVTEKMMSANLKLFDTDRLIHGTPIEVYQNRMAVQRQNEITIFEFQSNEDLKIINTILIPKTVSLSDLWIHPELSSCVIFSNQKLIQYDLVNGSQRELLSDGYPPIKVQFNKDDICLLTGFEIVRL